MDVEEALTQFAEPGGAMPDAAMRWSLDNWEIAGPRFRAMLDAYVAGDDLSEATERALFFTLHLCAEKRDTQIYPPLCLLLLDAEATNLVLDDGVTETLTKILISVFDGDLAPLQSVIESGSADCFARDAALTAMAYLTAAGMIAEERMRAYLLHLEKTMQPRAEDFIWAGWAITIGRLGFADLRPQVLRAFEQGFVPLDVMGKDDFDRDLAQAASAPSLLAHFESERIGPWTDSIAMLSSWTWTDDDPDDDFPDVAEPVVNPFRDVGRNDPCPCGSGKKFKKCCLGANPFA